MVGADNERPSEKRSSRGTTCINKALDRAGLFIKLKAHEV